MSVSDVVNRPYYYLFHTSARWQVLSFDSVSCNWRLMAVNISLEYNIIRLKNNLNELVCLVQAPLI